MPVKKKGSSKKAAASARAGAGIGRVMGEFKRGQLRSGSGGKVTNPRQAIAIGLSEARQAGAAIPARSAAKKTAARKKGSTAT